MQRNLATKLACTKRPRVCRMIFCNSLGSMKIVVFYSNFTDICFWGIHLTLRHCCLRQCLDAVSRRRYLYKWTRAVTPFDFTRLQCVNVARTEQNRWYFAEHDDVIKLKHFPRFWLFVRGIHWSPVNPPPPPPPPPPPAKASDVELWCFLWSAPE